MVMVLVLFLTGVVYYKSATDIKTMESWGATHAACSTEAIPDLKKITGDVKILPGRDLSLDIDLTFGSKNEAFMQKALFTLNPGQEIKSVSNAAGEPLPFSHEKGLLEILLPQPLKAGEVTTVRLRIQGLPDNRFAYLYSAVDINSLKFIQEDLFLLGSAPGVFDGAFVALMPGLRWLPASGPEKDGKRASERCADYFNIDLKVDLPEGWLVAGPGWRHTVKDRDPETRAFNYLLEILSNTLITDTRSFFTAHTFLEESDLDSALGLTVVFHTTNRRLDRGLCGALVFRGCFLNFPNRGGAVAPEGVHYLGFQFR